MTHECIISIIYTGTLQCILCVSSSTKRHESSRCMSLLCVVSHPYTAQLERLSRLISWVQLVEDAFQGSDTDDEDGDPEDARPKKAPVASVDGGIQRPHR